MDIATPTILAIMGSGETSPTMVTVHRGLVDRLPADRRTGELLDAPYGFQTNAADISARAVGYFARSVGLPVRVLADADVGPAPERALAALRTAPWVFAGPGSPSYALRRWLGHPIGRALCDRLHTGSGLSVLASAAAATLGRFAVPVYEIYKVGAEPHWLPGLDALTAVGLPVVLIPHFDNTEGGTHDTRFCYLGEQRLLAMERQLPDDCAVLGVDEHTAMVIDLAAGTVEVTGRGVVTVRRCFGSTVLPAGSGIGLAELRALVTARHRPPQPPAGPGQPGPAAASDPTSTSDRTGAAGRDGGSGRSVARPMTLAELTVDCEARFTAAADPGQQVTAILELEAAIWQWAGDTEEDEGTEQARAVLRSLVVRLGELAATGAADPADRIAPLVEPLLAARRQLRDQRAYPAADAIRQALALGGVDLRDTGTGTAWTWQSPHDRAATVTAPEPANG